MISRTAIPIHLEGTCPGTQFSSRRDPGFKWTGVGFIASIQLVRKSAKGDPQIFPFGFPLIHPKKRVSNFLARFSLKMVPLEKKIRRDTEKKQPSRTLARNAVLARLLLARRLASRSARLLAGLGGLTLAAHQWPRDGARSLRKETHACGV